jgi:hypothetical protein
MNKNSNILLVVSSIAVVGVLGYLLMRQLKQTQKLKSESVPKDSAYSKYVAQMNRKKSIENRTPEEMRADFEKYGY